MPVGFPRARRTGHRAARAVLWGLTVAHLVEAGVLRHRRGQLRALPGRDATAGDLAGKVDVVSLPGVDADGRTVAAVAREMELSGAAVIDLVPGDLPADRALPLLRRIDPTRLGDPFHSPGGAHEAVALHPSVAERMAAGPGGDGSPRDRGAMVRRTVTAQRYAPTSAAVRVAPDLHAGPAGPHDRWRELEELSAATQPYGTLVPLLVGAETAHLLALTAGVLVAPAAGAAALLTWAAQPALVLGGPSGDPPSLGPPGVARASLLRLPRAWAGNLRTALAGHRETRARNARRARTPIPPPPATEELFETARDTCPWCGSGALTGCLDVTDLLQHKPGTFHLDECGGCGHIFQNPALTVAGLDHYYENAYDGIGEEQAESSFASLGAIYRNRVESLARFTEPRAWLDVGTGHAHFCLAARERWPDATFDGLDMSETVEEAQRRGRIDTAYRGHFPDLADGLPRSYDVVSMHHYIEHTREPRREIAAAAKVLEPGGYLMIEMPDPASPWSRRLGRYWWQWGQPQHQHFVTCENLVAALQDSGFEMLSVERGPATMGGELFNAVGLVVQARTRSPHLPWHPRPSAARQAARVGLVTALLPALAVAKVADVVKDARLGPDDAGNAYRLVARRT